MNPLNLTSEQMDVINHPLDQHARVLAVAGSGKSLTLAYRVKHLVEDLGVAPESIRVLMFNAYARRQFRERLEQVGLAEDLRPEVHTYHSFSYKVIRAVMHTGVLPELVRFWIGEKEPLLTQNVQRAIRNLNDNGSLQRRDVQLEEALQVIGLWKGALLPPERAGCSTHPILSEVYLEFERLRVERVAVTFDDFVPLAVDILKNIPQANERWVQTCQAILVDEYQDVNYSQQKLIEMLASAGADVMAVGDDDQTIYEWRGARPDYLLNDFASVFNNKPVLDYPLSLSFRFGPEIAQAAANVIANNLHRLPKTIQASDPEQESFIQVFMEDSARCLAEQIETLINEENVAPAQIAVLGRLYSQLDELAIELLQRGIPFRIDGHPAFFQQSEIQTPLDYVRIAEKYKEPLTPTICELFLKIANQPNRWLSMEVLTSLLSLGRASGLTLFETLGKSYLVQSGAGSLVHDRLFQLQLFLLGLSGMVESNDMAGGLLEHVVEHTGYTKSFQDFYGPGEHAEERIQSVHNFLHYAMYTNMPIKRFLKHLEELDTTLGRPLAEQVVLTSIHRTKGLEFDYVILPACNENALPFLKEADHLLIYDRWGQFHQLHSSDPLESERRLFYVALTRAKQGVLIGTGENPSRFLEEMDLQE